MRIAMAACVLASAWLAAGTAGAGLSPFDGAAGPGRRRPARARPPAGCWPADASGAGRAATVIGGAVVATATGAVLEQALAGGGSDHAASGARLALVYPTVLAYRHLLGPVLEQSGLEAPWLLALPYGYYGLALPITQHSPGLDWLRSSGVPLPYVALLPEPWLPYRSPPALVGRWSARPGDRLD